MLTAIKCCHLAELIGGTPHQVRTGRLGMFATVVSRQQVAGRDGQVVVLPVTSLARAAAVQRFAGIPYPVAVGSVRVWTEQSPRVDRARRGRRR
jgi:hypothetical protein